MCRPRRRAVEGEWPVRGAGGPSTYFKRLLSGIQFKNWRVGMKKGTSFKVILSVGLSLYLTLGPCLSAAGAAGPGRRSGADPS